MGPWPCVAGSVRHYGPGVMGVHLGGEGGASAIKMSVTSSSVTQLGSKTQSSYVHICVWATCREQPHSASQDTTGLWRKQKLPQSIEKQSVLKVACNKTPKGVT